MNLLGLDRHARQVAVSSLRRQPARYWSRPCRARAPAASILSLPGNPDGGGLPGLWLSPVRAPSTGADAPAASG